jgi:hypothetical protein
LQHGNTWGFHDFAAALVTSLPTSRQQCEDNLLKACEQTCNNLFADLLQAVRFYMCR